MQAPLGQEFLFDLVIAKSNPPQTVPNTMEGLHKYYNVIQVLKSENLLLQKLLPPSPLAKTKEIAGLSGLTARLGGRPFSKWLSLTT